MADWRVLGASPPLAFNQAALGIIPLPPSSGTVASKLIRRVPLPAADESQASLQQVFGFGAHGHCFAATPHRWTNFHEPQVTGGFAHFLNQGGKACRYERCRAFVYAALAAASRPTGHLSLIGNAQAWAEENNIDLIVELRGAGGRFGAVVEAKFGHRLTQGQLPTAEKHVRARDWDLALSALIVLAPDAAKVDSLLLAESPAWRPLSWWSFLHQFEANFDSRYDSDDFRRFRSTVWFRSY